MNDRYVLDESGEPRPEPDLMTWAKWFEASWPARKIAQTELADDVSVSTVFLAIDHNWFGTPPILFETMVFGGPYDGYQWRHHTRAQAIAKHDQIVANLRRANPLPFEELGLS